MRKFTNRVVVITGIAQGIGAALAKAFRERGALVCGIDLQSNDYYIGDLADKETLEAFCEKVFKDFGHVDILINNTTPLMKGIETCSYEDFERALRVGVTAAFYLTKLFLPYFSAGASIINLSSTREHMSQAQSESYSAAKGGIGALTHALAVSLAGKVRVNAISPGWIETGEMTWQGADAAQHLSARVGKPEDIVQTAMFLCSEAAGFINAENIRVDGGMSRRMIYHGDEGWELTEF